jgi:peptidoglycan/LPS O-acetylase OafA/YrhL
MTSKPARIRLDALTSLRFFAAIIVVIGHFGKETNLAALSPRLLTSGPQMVTFFFVLSGFVMTLAYFPRETSSFRAYYLARIARIVPVYYVALGITAYFTYGWGDNGPGALTVSGTFLQAWLPNFVYTYNLPAWSLSVEAVFYVLFPFILLILKAKRPSPLTVILSALGLWALTQAVLTGLINSESFVPGRSFSHCLILYFPLSHMCSFFLGTGAGLWFLARDPAKSKWEIGTTALMLIALVLTYFALEQPQRLVNLAGRRLPLSSSFLAPLFMLLITTFACSRNLLTRALCVRPLVLLGEASYGLYILQVPIHKAYQSYVEKRVDLSEQNHFYLYASILLVISILSLYFVEKPGSKLVYIVADRLQRLRASTPDPALDTNAS